MWSLFCCLYQAFQGKGHKYEVSSLSDETKVKAGDPVYRMITSEDWSVIVPLSKADSVNVSIVNPSYPSTVKAKCHPAVPDKTTHPDRLRQSLLKVVLFGSR